MPRLLVAALAVAAIAVLGTTVPKVPLIAVPEFHPHFEFSVSLTL